MTATETKNVYQGRYGFHSCDKETYLKLKLIYKVYWESVFRLAAWNRWDRKEPQNRVQRFQGRGPDGKRIPLPKPVPLPEPELPPFLKKLEHQKTVKTHVGDCKQWKGPVYDLVWHTVKMDPSIYAAVQDFQNARTPMVESQVKPVVCTPEKIDALYQQAKDWLAR